MFSNNNYMKIFLQKKTRCKHGNTEYQYNL